MVGTVGRVITRIRSGNTPGEISLMVRGCPEVLIAYCDTPQAVGERVLVINTREAHSVDVIAWDGFE